MSESSAPIGENWIERVAVAAAAPIYLLHTVRLAIYVSPGGGLRECRGAVEELETAAVARRVDTNVLGIVSMVNRVALRTPCPQARCPAAIRFLARIVMALPDRGKDLVVRRLYGLGSLPPPPAARVEEVAP